MADTLQLTDKIAVVLDMGTTTLRAVAALLDENNKVSRIIATEEADSKGVRHGRVENYVNLAGVLKPMFNNLSNRIYNALKASIGESFIGTRVEIKRVYIALGGEGIEGRAEQELYLLNNEFIDETATTKIQNNIKERVQNDKEEILELINQGYNVDDDIKMEAVGCRGTNVIGRYCVVTAKKEVKSDIIQTLSSINIEFAGYSILPFALADVMLTEADKEVGTTLIDLGASSTSIAIYRDNVRRHVRVLPIGSKLITKDIKNVCGLTQDVAESVKKKMGCAYPGGLKENLVSRISGTDVTVEQVELASIIEARLEQLMSYILGEMDKVNALTATRKIVLTGRGARLKKICEKFTDEFGLDTEIGKIKDLCYEKYSPYFSQLESNDVKKSTRKMNEYAACLGVLESCVLDSCVTIGNGAKKTIPTKNNGNIFKRVLGIFDTMANTAEGLIDSEIK